ncbi:hypothetical protein [Pseudomonas sp. BMW13]|uniref:hypothetical protein n=1 Tax=Pseudomonas sp. BMW13 TaxID=2562590 RepID=UPI0015815AE7|nr:hypothetical protein [Pseudomonas sp. BMW13]
MTINIAVATYDSIVLGCDSLSSVVEPAVSFRTAGFARDANGVELVDASGHKVISTANLTHYVTNVFSGAQKMFLLYEDADTSVAAVTAGMATLCGVTIAGIASRFRRSTSHQVFNTVEEVANEFKTFVRREWEKEVDFVNADEEMRPFFPDVQFIVGGYGKDDDRGRLFKIWIAPDVIRETVSTTETGTGACWGGQAEFVERLLMGVDAQIEQTITRIVTAALNTRTQKTVEQITEQLEEAGVNIPDNLQLEGGREELDLPWRDSSADIDFANLPTQYAVEFVELLVNTQSGMQRFANGVATVGGRTHVGVLRRGEKFEMLNEPQLVHNHTGYSHDL